MKALQRIGLFSFIGLTAIACIPGGPNKGQEALEEEQRVFPVRVQTVERDTITRTLDYSANLTAYKEIYYAPASPGRINKINVEVGDRIREGQILVEMDKTQLNTAMTQLASAEDSYRRIKTLYEQGSFAEQQYEQTKTQYELAKQNVDYLAENVDLESPINGIVTGKYFENGEIFAGAPNTQIGKAAIVTIIQVNPLKAMVSISQSFYADVKSGMRVNISTDLLLDQVFEGTIKTVYPTINPMTRTFDAEVIVKNPGEILRPGMFAKVEIELMEENVLMVPAISVLKQSGTNQRYILLHESGTARRVEVRMGKRIDDQVEVISEEPIEGKQLIVEGQARLVDGSSVQVVTQ